MTERIKYFLLSLTTIAQLAFVLPATAQTSKSEAGELTLINAYDAFGREIKGLKQDFGFSCVIKYKGKTILFDAGTDSDIFQSNLKTLKIDPRKIDVAVVSHGHYDHLGGFDYLLRVNPKMKIYAPADFFSLGAPVKFPFREAEPNAAKNLPKDEQYFRGEKSTDGMITVPTGRFGKANVEYLTQAKEVLPGLTLIPTASELMGTFIKYPPFDKNPQFIEMPELSASFALRNGQVIIAGCSHSTIETIIRETVKVRPEKVVLVAGGLHLIPYSREYIEDLAKRMRDVYGVERIAPAHCSGQLGFTVLRQIFGGEYEYFGLGETIKL
jgi:7,8-dihydropterin-6-yl-methyl-4-(beta-D-ribofuranosyl)aminobenzene 5'-phosphate synthase